MMRKNIKDLSLNIIVRGRRYKMSILIQRVLCSDEKCSSRNCPKPINIKDDLLLIGDGYKCPYCRGYTFILIK